MANEFKVKNGLISDGNIIVTGSISSTGSLTVDGPISATTFTGDGSQLTGIEGFPFTGSAGITGSLTVIGPINASSFTGSLEGTATSSSYVEIGNIDGFSDYSSSVNVSISSVLDATTPITSTVNTLNSPFTITSQSILVVDSTDGNITVNLPDLDTIVGTSNQKPIVVYKNDYSQNVIYVQPNGAQLINGTTQDIIVSIQLAVIYNPTSAGWVTEGTSAQSLAELELFFVPRTETGSFATTGSNSFNGNQTITGSVTVTGGINATVTGTATSASYVEYTDVANKPSLVSGSEQISFNGITDKPELVSSSIQIADYGIFATTGSNQFNGSQAITGSLTVTGEVVAQTLNVQEVTSSIVYSSGSNIFGNDVSNTQQFTGSMYITGSVTSYGQINTEYPNSTLIIADSRPYAQCVGGKISLQGNYRSAGDITEGGYIRASKTNASDGDYGFDLIFANHTYPNNVSEKMRISSTGNVGIGCVNPGYKLDINGNTNIAGTLNIQNANNINWNGGDVGISNDSTDLVFKTYSSSTLNEKMRITSTGNVGINVTSPQSSLHIIKALGNDVISVGETGTNTRFTIGQEASYTGNYINSRNIDLKFQTFCGGGSGGNIYFQTGTDGTGCVTTKMLINKTGDVGIGTDTPTEKLHVSTGVDADAGLISILLGGTVANSRQAKIEKQTSGTRGLSIYSSLSNSSVFEPITFYTGVNNPKLTILEGGNVGIGITDPSSLLTISTTSGNTVLRMIRNNVAETTNDFASIRFTNSAGITLSSIRATSDNGNTNAALRFSAGTGDTEYMRITSAGRVGIGTTNPGYPLHIYCCSPTGAKIETCGSTFGSPSLNLLNGAIDTVLSATSNGLEIGTWSSHEVQIKTVQQTRLTIANNGPATFACQVSISTGFNSAYGKLQVAGIVDSFANDSSFRVFNAASSFTGGVGTDQWAFAGSNTDLAVYGPNSVYMYAGGQRRLNILSTGITSFACQICAPQIVSSIQKYETNALSFTTSAGGTNTFNIDIAGTTGLQVAGNYQTADIYFQAGLYPGATTVNGRIGIVGRGGGNVANLYAITCVGGIGTLTITPYGNGTSTFGLCLQSNCTSSAVYWKAIVNAMSV